MLSLLFWRELGTLRGIREGAGQALMVLQVCYFEKFYLGLVYSSAVKNLPHMGKEGSGLQPSAAKPTKRYKMLETGGVLGTEIIKLSVVTQALKEETVSSLPSLKFLDVFKLE